MSEMTEVNHSMPSINGAISIGIANDGYENGASTTLKTNIPLQEVSAVREEPIPAAAHYLPSDDRSTAAAASAATDGDRQTMESMPGSESGTKAAIDGPGHELDVRGLNGSGLAKVDGQSGREMQSGNEIASQNQPGMAPASAGEFDYSKSVYLLQRGLIQRDC